MSGTVRLPDNLERTIDELYADAGGAADRARAAVDQLLALLEDGSLRAATRTSDGSWRAIPWVKRGILLGFRVGTIVDMSVSGRATFSFFDKSTFPPRVLGLEDGVRVVPGGSSIRRGAYVGRGVTCMPPCYVNVGAYIGAGSMVDSHALVGSCAQIGERVHLSAAAQIGGVLEPINAAPVVIEDDVMIGGNCGVYEGTVVSSRAVVGAGVILTRSTPVYDIVNETVYRATADSPLVIPPGAVVIPGARRVAAGWGSEMNLSIATPIIVKYRDARTDAATALEQALR